MLKNKTYPNFVSIFNREPNTVANVKGSDDYPSIKGEVSFYQTNYGVLVVTDVVGLPKSQEICKSPIFAFHIHKGDSCTGNEQDAFKNAETHYNPNDCEHPYHAGDLPPLFGANGNAFSAVLTDRFNVKEIIDKTVIIHSSLDDFTTQPSGNSGTKIACGKIKLI